MQDLEREVAPYQGNTCKVEAGLYWRRSDWELTPVSGKKGGTLPGVREDYRRIPTILAPAAVVAMGGLHVLFLPLVGYAIIGYEVGKRAIIGIQDGYHELAMAMGPQQVPGETRVLGTPKGKKTVERKPTTIDAVVEKKD